MVSADPPVCILALGLKVYLSLKIMIIINEMSAKTIVPQKVYPHSNGYLPLFLQGGVSLTPSRRNPQRGGILLLLHL